ncbi:MAG TPA: GNAT family N-acetyltransferase [Cytophagaceae bacterium]|jgi:cyclohexyl-isocyanide hydratase
MDLIEIKEIKSDQIAVYKSFFQVGLKNDEDNFRISLNDDLSAPFPTKDSEDSFTLGAYVKHELVGVVSFERDGEHREKLRHKGTLFRMYVSSQSRGLGVGKTLIKTLFDMVKNIPNIERINLTVISHNINAIKLYEGFSFVIFSKEVNAIKWKGRYFTELQMAVKIPAND